MIKKTSRAGKFVTLAVAAAALVAVGAPLSSANAQLLGDIYLEEKPDQAVLCFQVYRNSQRAGADTMFKLGRAYENLGDFARAAKCYEHVTAFEGHPLYYEAQDGINRVRRSGNPVG